MADGATAYSGNQRATDVAFALGLVFACFTLASTSYLAWLYRLFEFVPAETADGLTMVGGYSFQALGIGLACAAMRAKPGFAGRVPFITVIAVHLACAAGAMFAGSLEVLVAFGLLMNFLCGALSAFYLHRLVAFSPRNRRGIAFGAGYAASIATTWALSQLNAGAPLGATGSMVACTVLSLAAIALVAVSGETPEIPASTETSDAKDSRTKPSAAIGALSLACVTVVLMSLVKNIGFSFPSADLMEGVSLETSRLFYAAGLVIAGLIADANRKYAALCCIAALAFPFGLLALASEPLPGTILWAADYLFYGFFSVYRVVLLCDIAEDSGRSWLSGFGLMFGRVGDALGTALCLALAGSTLALVATATVLFAATAFAFHHLLLQLHPAAPAPRKTDKELFEEFAAAYNLSLRERDVLRLVLDRRTNAEIAAELFITEGTVKYHVHNLLTKIDCPGRAALIAKYTEFHSA